MKASTKPMSRGTAIKVRRKVRPKIDGIDYLGLCRGQPCYLLLPSVRAHDGETVVPAHSNQSQHGKGMGLKASDIFTIPACGKCHHELDQGKLMSRAERVEAWDAAYARWKSDRSEILSESLPRVV